MKYLIVIEKTRTGFGAYSPDLDGCVATARTRPAVRKLMREAIQFHLEGMLIGGQRAPLPTSTSAYVDVPRPKRERPTRRPHDFPKGVRSAVAARYAERRNTEAAIGRKRP